MSTEAPHYVKCPDYKSLEELEKDSDTMHRLGYRLVTVLRSKLKYWAVYARVGKPDAEYGEFFEEELED